MEMIVVNGEKRPLPAHGTVAALLGELGLTGRRIAVERNGEIVPRSRHDTEALAPGDRLEIVVAVGGG
ncbi:MAG TPA: sulfur carrier protein ThiS [Burkholderiaceae bacterium]|nr:sulfur carrier protein ThiS [Burkholderiaceae bacterium]HMM53036.1 sulfur carrier protein ThiS [Burkholderiaceae bacterium]